MNGNAGGVVAVAVAAVLATSLPDPGEPTIVLFIGGIGGLLGAAIGRARGLPRERLREVVENWVFVCGVAGAALYVLALVVDL